MKKHYIIITVIIILAIMLSGCNRVKTYLNKPKVQNDYYTNELINSLNKENIVKISIFYREFFKEFTIAPDNYDDIINFVHSIDNTNIISKPADLPDISKFKIIISLSNNKYVINVFNENYVSIYSWDGDFSEDYVKMNNIPLAYNAYGLCKYYTKD